MAKFDRAKTRKLVKVKEKTHNQLRELSIELDRSILDILESVVEEAYNDICKREETIQDSANA